MHEAVSYLGDAGDFLLVNRFARRTGWLHPVLTAYAEYGLVVFLGLIAWGWWASRRSNNPAQMAAVVWTALAALAAVGINQPIVSAVHEARPYTSIPHVLVLVSRTSDLGFPSDHATMAGAVAAGLCFVGRRLGIVAWLAAVVMAFARVYVGAHYPHDVLAGLLLGATVAVVGWLLLRVPLQAVVSRLATTRLQPLLLATPATKG